MSFSILIPARYESTRLPGKVLLDIAGKPLIQRVYEQSKLAGAQSVYIATDSEKVAACCRRFGADVVMTASEHASGTDRIAEAVGKLALDEQTVVVNIQGDEPGLPPALVQNLAKLLRESNTVEMATVCVPIKVVEEVFDPNVVKVVMDENNMALYFSRAPIPWKRDEIPQNLLQQGQQGHTDLNLTGYYRHLGIYAYRVGFLKRYVNLAPAPLESWEKLEQLRALHYGYKIQMMVSSDEPGIGVDTQADLIKANELYGKK